MKTKEKILLIHDHSDALTKSIISENENQIIFIVENILKTHKISLIQINIILLSDKALLDINQKYLKHDEYTDIITFNYADEKNKVDAELYISYQRVIENAHKSKTEFINELMRVVIHGCLHLCGFKDKTETEQTIMTEKENYYLKLFHVEQS